MTIIFIVSLVVLFGLLSYKVFEIKIKRIHFVANIFERGDGKIHGVLEKFISQYNRIKNVSHIFIFEFLPSYLYELLVKAKDSVSKRYYSGADNFRGRRVLRNNGSVSFFLERLSKENSPIDETKFLRSHLSDSN